MVILRCDGYPTEQVRRTRITTGELNGHDGYWISGPLAVPAARYIGQAVNFELIGLGDEIFARRSGQ